ncbi:MAG TPA: hypothetical protein VFX27_06655 [Sphingobium sp.]|nr:hypothetical protein [Sphingobium sp.]
MRTLLHKIAAGDDRVTLIPTDRDRLRAQAFLDGRSDFSSGPAIETSLTQWRASLTQCPTPDRTIFHVGFCGSTLLARLLDVPGQALVLREPNCLADLANQNEDGGVLDLVRRHLRCPWADGEPVIVKPSNWANSLLREFAASAEPMLPVFLHMTRDAFLRAIFRGGDQRIAFAARAAVHLSNGSDRDALLVARALEDDGQDGLKLARLALVLFELQMRLFSDACSAAGWGAERWLTHEELADDPFATAKRAADLLEIEIPVSDVEKNVLCWRSRHAKSPNNEFIPAHESTCNEALSASHGAVMEAALDWADTNLG